MLMDMFLPKFDIYQIYQFVLRATQALDVLIFFPKKKVLFDVRSEINLLQCNTIPTGQSVRA